LRRKRMLEFTDSFVVNVPPFVHPQADAFTNDQTIEMWLYPYYFENASQPLNDDNGEFLVSIDTGGNVQYGWSYDSSSDLQTISLGPINALEWAHVAFVRDMKAKQNHAYLNGTLVNSSGFNVTVAAPTSKPLVIGSSYSGAIVDLRAWETARGAEQIKANMHLRLTGQEEGLVGCWPLDDGMGTTVRDIGPYKNYGTVELPTGSGELPAPNWPLAIDSGANPQSILHQSEPDDERQRCAGGSVPGGWRDPG
jgi:hypothetical protein